MKKYIDLFDAQTEQAKKKEMPPKLLLHACCAPCSSYVLSCLSDIFDITLFFFNPNISPYEEYEFRAQELERLVVEMGLQDKIKTVVEEYCPESFQTIATGKENEPEKGSRCTECYSLRLKKTAEYAAKNGYGYFSTTLSISPHKDADRINALGEKYAQTEGVEWLYSDFKKRNGYKISCELSEKYGLYRQDYCGCVYSKRS